MSNNTSTINNNLLVNQDQLINFVRYFSYIHWFFIIILPTFGFFSAEILLVFAGLLMVGQNFIVIRAISLIEKSLIKKAITQICISMFCTSVIAIVFYPWVYITTVASLKSKKIAKYDKI
jgi:hypothetical protein